MNYEKPKRSCMNFSGTQFFPLIFNGNENNSLGCYKITGILSQKTKKGVFSVANWLYDLSHIGYELCYPGRLQVDFVACEVDLAKIVSRRRKTLTQIWLRYENILRQSTVSSFKNAKNRRL